MRYGELLDLMGDPTRVWDAERVMESVIRDGLLSEIEINAVRTLISISKMRTSEVIADSIIPCGECKYGEEIEDEKSSRIYIRCHLDKETRIRRYPDDFCSYGKKSYYDRYDDWGYILPMQRDPVEEYRTQKIIEEIESTPSLLTREELESMFADEDFNI